MYGLSQKQKKVQLQTTISIAFTNLLFEVFIVKQPDLEFVLLVLNYSTIYVNKYSYKGIL